MGVHLHRAWAQDAVQPCRNGTATAKFVLIHGKFDTGREGLFHTANKLVAVPESNGEGRYNEKRWRAGWGELFKTHERSNVAGVANLETVSDIRLETAAVDSTGGDLALLDGVVL